MKKIIALTDFSPESMHAVNYAADVAMHLRAEFIIFHTVQLSLAVPETTAVGDMVENEVNTAVAALSDLKAAIQLYTGHVIPVHTKFKIGPLHEELETIALHEKPLAVFMASRGLNAVERFFFGSNTLTITGDNFFPVIVVPPLAFFSGFRKIGFATDLQNIPAEAPLNFLRHWLKMFNTQLDIVHVCGETDINATQLSASVDLQNNFTKFNLQYHFITQNDVQKGIYEYVETNSPELLIISPGKHGIFHKSESKHFIIQPPVPVMVLPENMVDALFNEALLHEIY